MNRTKGPIFGGIYVARLAEHFEIPIRHYEEEEKLLPPTFLNYKSMVAYEFIVANDENMLNYTLRYHKKHSETIILHAPSLFDLSTGTFLVLPEAARAYQGQYQPQSLSRNHNLTLIDHPFISGIWRSLPASGTQTMHPSTLEGVALTHGHRPT